MSSTRVRSSISLKLSRRLFHIGRLKQLHSGEQAVENKVKEEKYASLLRSCRSLESVSAVHTQIVQDGYGDSSNLRDVLIQVYGRFGSLDVARLLFDRAGKKSTFSWTALIAAYAQNGHCKDALEVFKLMDVQPSRYTYLNVVGVCSDLRNLTEGRLVHARIMVAGELQDDVSLQNALINMYSKCGCLSGAEAVFHAMLHRDVVTWNSMISAYAQNDKNKLAVELYQRMNREGFTPDEYTFSSVISACSTYEEGKSVHQDIISAGTHSNNVAIQNALINMYTRCDKLVEAESVFDAMHKRNVISWTAMISAFTQHDRGRDAIFLFRKMDLEGVQPNNVTYATVLTACSNEGMLAEGRMLHSRITNPDFIVQNTLLNLYGKCGRVAEAREVFQAMKTRTVITWTTMIAAYAQQGRSQEALELGRTMDLEGTLPNTVTFGCILVACSYAGMLDQGWIYFTSMSSDYGLQPQGEHYICMVDLLGRAGKVLEAEELVDFIPSGRESLGWMALLGACRLQNDPERGTRAAEHAFQRLSKESGVLVLLSQVFSNKVDSFSQNVSNA